MGKIVEGLWNCRYCDSKGIKGRFRECPNCGRPRDDSTKFYMPSEISYVSEGKANTISRNPDWLCIYCNSLNSDSDDICKSCGSKRNMENPDYFSMKKSKEVQSGFSSHVEYSGKKSYDFTTGTNTSTTTSALNRFTSSTFSFFKKSWKYFVIAILSISLLSGLIYLLIPKNEEITITSFSWERSISIEKYQTVEESSWSLPSDARLQYTRQEIYTYQEVFDHFETRSRQVAKQRFSHYEDHVSYRDLGNGYFEEVIDRTPVYETYYETEYYQEPIYRNEPVYKTKYYYEIDKWLYDRSLKSNGSDQNPYWHEIPSLPSNERVSDRSEKYYIIGFNKKNKEKKISLQYEIWKELKTDQTVKLKVSILGDGELIE